jgi:hypothetical protein
LHGEICYYLVLEREGLVQNAIIEKQENRDRPVAEKKDLRHVPYGHLSIEELKAVFWDLKAVEREIVRCLEYGADPHIYVRANIEQKIRQMERAAGDELSREEGIPMHSERNPYSAYTPAQRAASALELRQLDTLFQQVKEGLRENRRLEEAPKPQNKPKHEM